MTNSFTRITLSVSIGINLILLAGLLILEARISKLESQHYNSTPLEIKLGFNGD